MNFPTIEQLDAWHDEAMENGSKRAINRLHDAAARMLHEMSLRPEETAYKAALEDVLKPFYYYRRSGSTPQVLIRDLQDAVMKHAAIIDTLDLGSPPQCDAQGEPK